jgi:hypothetical protein
MKLRNHLSMRNYKGGTEEIIKMRNNKGRKREETTRKENIHVEVKWVT